MLCWFLPSHNMNQLYIHMNPFPCPSRSAEQQAELCVHSGSPVAAVREYAALEVFPSYSLSPHLLLPLAVSTSHRALLSILNWCDGKKQRVY